MRRRDDLAARLANPNLTPDEISTLVAEADEVRAAIDAHNRRDALLGADGTNTHGGRGLADTPPHGTPETPMTVRTYGEAALAFTESEQARAFRTSGYSGRVGMEFPALSTRALIDTSATSGGAFQNPMRPEGASLLNPARVPRIVDLLDQRTTNENTVEWVQDTSAAGTSAAEVAEGAIKPEATFTFQVITDPVRTIAHWVNVTRQSFDDSQSLQAHVDGRLMYGLDYRLDAQVLNGDGQGANLRGILNRSGINTYVAPTGEAALLSIRKALTVAQRVETTPDGVVLNPLDWERVEMSQDSQGQFRVSPSVGEALAPRIWGLRVVTTNAIAGTAPDPDATGPLTATTGRFLVGAFRQGATLWRRSSGLWVSDSHASNFTSNILTILAEMRVALSVTSPKSFVAGTFADGSA